MKALALVMVLAATPASAGALILGLAGGALPPSELATAPAPACPACAQVPPTEFASALVEPIRIPPREELVGEGRWMEPSDLAVFEALRATRCAQLATDCVDTPVALRFTPAGARAQP